MLTRLPCWQCSLAKFLSDNQHRAFAYGSFDCCLFVCDAILAMTGTDVAAAFRGKYSSYREALAFGSVKAITERITAEYRMSEVPVLSAQRGDVALIKRARGYSLGVLDLDGIHLAVLSRSGIDHVPLAQASRAWRV